MIVTMKQAAAGFKSNDLSRLGGIISPSAWNGIDGCKSARFIIGEGKK